MDSSSLHQQEHLLLSQEQAQESTLLQTLSESQKPLSIYLSPKKKLYLTSKIIRKNLNINVYNTKKNLYLSLHLFHCAPSKKSPSLQKFRNLQLFWDPKPVNLQSEGRNDFMVDSSSRLKAERGLYRKIWTRAIQWPMSEVHLWGFRMGQKDVVKVYSKAGIAKRLTFLDCTIVQNTLNDIELPY